MGTVVAGGVMVVVIAAVVIVGVIRVVVEVSIVYSQQMDSPSRVQKHTLHASFSQ